MENGVDICIILSSDKVTIENVTKWFKENPFFEPMHMRCKYLTKGNIRKFKHEHFFGGISKEIDNEVASMTVINGESDCSLHMGAYTKEVTWFDYHLAPEMYESNKIKVFEYINDFMRDYGGIVARVCSAKDYFWQNNEDIHYHCMKGKSMEGVHTKPRPMFPDDMIVDTEYNPGHSHIVNGIWLGSCWAMWFGQGFFNYIPKDVLKNYQGCYENTEISDDLIRILLYENIWEYDEPNNRERQFGFRRQVGIDEVAHSLLKQPQKTPDNPAIEIESGSFEHGSVRLITYYYNDEGELVSKSKAIVAKTYELNETGKTVREETRELK